MAYEDDPFRPDTNTPTIRLGTSEDEVIDLPPHLRLEPGDQVGHYRILSLVAEGGFGIVYLAEQHTPVRRRVALKIIKPGMDTVGVITRFEAERQALAILDHPGIATVYDAGATDDGRPFFVMEYVEGEPITEYCDDHRLETTERLQLMIEVCAAVQHAHTKGIIHRDLKPSNILVSTDPDGQPRPKVIDFGVAKATSMELTERSFCTETGQLIGTPEYMSPEQADLGSVDVDTRSDVYSLGMIIYELVTGALPFESIQMRQAGFSELCRIIQEEQPPKPSTRLISLGGEASKVATRRRTRPADLANMLRRELDWIPLKALRKDREERYESAVSLADDIRRYIEGDVLLAGPETSAYRLRKFLRRNRGGVLAAAFVFITLLAGLNVSLVLLAETRSAQRTSLEQQSQLEDVNKELQQAQLTYMEALVKLEDAKSDASTRAQKMEQDLLYLQQATYTSNLHNARDALVAGETPSARTHLRMAEEGHAHERPFEWQYLWAQAEGSLALLAQPDERLIRAVVSPKSDFVFTMSTERFASWEAGADYDTARAVAMASMTTSNQDPAVVLLAPDGKTALLGHPNQERTLIDTVQANPIGTFPAVPKDLPTFVFSGDGRRIAHGGDDSKLNVHDSRTARLIAEVPIPENVTEVVLDSTGSRVAALNGDRVHLLNVAVGESTTPPLVHDLPVTAAAFDSSAIRLATATMSGQIHVWDVLTGREIASWPNPVNSIETLTFSPNGNVLHIQSKNDSHALLDLQTGFVIAEPTGAWSLNDDWSTLVTAQDSFTLTIKSLTNTSSPRSILVNSPTATAFSSQGDRLVTADSSGNIHVWDLSETELKGLRVGHHQTSVTHVSFADDDNRILAVSRTGPRLWSASGHDRVEELDLQDNTPAHLAFTPGLPWLVNGTRDGDILIIDMDTGDTISRLSGHEGEIVHLLHVADGTRLVSTSRDNTIRLWNLQTGQQMYSADYSWWTETPIALDSTTNLLVIPDRKQNLQLVDVNNGEIRSVLKGHRERVTQLEFDSTGTRLATADAEGGIRLWGLENDRLLALLQSHDQSVTGLAFSSDGSRLLSGSEDGSIKIWDPRVGREFTDLQIFAQMPIRVIALSPDNQQIAAGLEDGSIRIWSTATGDQLNTLPTGLSEIQSIEWSPNGDVLVAVGEDDSLRTWETSNWQPGATLAGSIADLYTWHIDADVDRIATVAERNILLYDTHTGDFIFTLRDHDDEVTQVAFSPDGSRLISTDVGGRLKIWSTKTRSQGGARRLARNLAEKKLQPVIDGWFKSGTLDSGQLEDKIAQLSVARSPEEVHTIRALVLKQQEAIGNAAVN
ncbi:MAG: protein kinase [Planctomycetota bacterium]|nr:protein kinase [Planctomycetota bacterium]